MPASSLTRRATKQPGWRGSAAARKFIFRNLRAPGRLSWKRTGAFWALPASLRPQEIDWPFRSRREPPAQATRLYVFTNHETRLLRFTGCQKFLLDRTSLHFSLRGEAKCVRGPSGRGASRLARAGVLEPYIEHGKQAQRSPGGHTACFGRRVVRNAGLASTNGFHESRDTKHESRLFRDTVLSNRCLLVLKPFSLFFGRRPV